MTKSIVSLEGELAIVTGAKTGIGKEIALTFAEAGADVVVCSRVVEGGQLEAVAKEIRKLGRRSLTIQADISLKLDVDRMVQSVIDEFGHIDILVNNAAVQIKHPILEFSEDDYDRIMHTDLKGYFFCSQAVAKRMVEKRKGNIINIASATGVTVAAIPGLGVYSIAKAGVIMLTKVFAKELASYQIRVNSIAPSSVKAPMSIVWNDPEAEKRIAASIPLGRVALPRDIAEAALFLASRTSSFITGITVPVAGGSLV